MPIGTCWAAGSWADGVWADNSWADVRDLSLTGPITNVLDTTEITRIC